ncbi:hypothetical protein OsJ_27722 [Oryza sativa Japonica Group]|uniref:Uncharacterized protein n=1 Tax=Oryza sativa subsp. japonica TaxID=39947 RepID=A3BU93_ORYSJ|nr:hypothetical protein OsJ_27722 [Oryza sativa Japonica Group]
MRTAATPPLAAAAAAVAAVFLSALLLASASASASRLPPLRRLLPLVGGEVAVAVVAGGGGEGAAGVEPAELLQQVLRVQPVRRGAGAHLVRPVRPRRRRAAHDAAPLVATFTNYKPLGWKCQCRDRLFDP